MSDIVTKPAVSQQQWKWMFATGQPFAHRWAKATPGGKGKRFRRLPVKVATKGYDAKAGGQIAGNLYRGNDGTFTAGASADDQAKETIARNKRINAAAPKGGKGKGKRKKAGGKRKAAKPRKPVKTPEQRKAEHDAKAGQNVASVQQQFKDNHAVLQPYGFERMKDLFSGKSLSEEDVNDLAEVGLIHKRSDGSYGPSSDAKAFWRAAQKGDYQGAVGAVNRARNQGAKKTATKSFVLKEAGHTGVMLALFPPSEVVQALSQVEGVTEPADQLHVTLTFLGDSTELPPDTREKLMSLLATFVENAQPLMGEINGVGRFFNAESDNTNAVYAAVDIPDLPTFRQSLIEGLKAAGVPVVENHGYTPHMTLAYVPQDTPTPDIRFTAIPVQFDAVTLAWGDEHTTYSTGHATKSFTVYKSASGQYRWLSVTTTAFEDLDGEIITKAALADEVARTGWAGDFGPLRWWHVGVPDGPGLDIGRCDLRMLSPSGLSLIESGTFADEQTAQAVATKADQYEVSPGFRCRPQERGRGKAYSTIRIFERSVVPRWAGRASNRLTTFTV